jgi:hypothetical protein
VDDEKNTTVTDAEIEAIIAQGEAGISSLVEAYEPLERQYFQAVNVNATSVTYSTDTNPL